MANLYVYPFSGIDCRLALHRQSSGKKTIPLPVLPSLHGVRIATLIKFLWSHRAKTKWRSRHVDESVGLATERLLRISPGSAIPYKRSLQNTPTSSLTSLHSHTHWELRSHKTFPCQIGHPFYWWFVTWNLKTHFRLVIWPIPQPAYIHLLIFFYHAIPLITPSTINNFVILRPLVLFLFSYCPVFVIHSTAPRTFIKSPLPILRSGTTSLCWCWPRTVGDGYCGRLH